MINSLLTAVKHYGRVKNYIDELTLHTITQDTRKLKKGDVYIAIKGEQFDGHDFIPKAIELGASAIITQHPIDSNICQFIVEDTLQFIQLASSNYRNDCKTTVIGITGTNGKTSTKELLYHIISSKYKTYRTPGNYNNHIGLPLSLLNMPKDSEYALIEIGTNHPGEIAFLTKILNPDISLITNIGYGHMEFFNTLEDVYKEKTDIYKYMNPNGIIFKNNSDKLLKNYTDNHKIYTFSLNSPKSDYCVSYHDGIGEYKNHTFKLAIDALHYYQNAAAVMAICDFIGLDIEIVISKLETFKAVDGRMNEVDLSNFHIINDAYNANPNSMTAALNMMENIEGDKMKIAVLGSMLELGANSQSQHHKILEKFEQSSINEILTYGEEFSTIDHKRSKHFNNKKDIVDFLNSIKEEVSILFKGSRGMALEEIIRSLKDLRSNDAS